MAWEIVEEGLFEGKPEKVMIVDDRMPDTPIIFAKEQWDSWSDEEKQAMIDEIVKRNLGRK